MVGFVVFQIHPVEGEKAKQSFWFENARVGFDVLGTLSEPIFEGVKGLLATGVEFASCFLQDLLGIRQLFFALRSHDFHYGSLVSAAGLHTGIGIVVKEGKHLIVLVLGERVVHMIMALGTFKGHPQLGMTFECAPVSYTHLRAHETVLDLVCRLLLEKKKK